MTKLRVTFEDPRSGGIWIQLQSAAQSVDISATYIYNGFFPLVEALHRLYLRPGAETVTWLCEPSEVEMQFTRTADGVHLDVVWFLDPRRRVCDRLEPAVSVTGSYEEVCLPFWRALRSLQGRYPAVEFEERWRGPFPTEELARLTQALGK